MKKTQEIYVSYAQLLIKHFPELLETGLLELGDQRINAPHPTL